MTIAFAFPSQHNTFGFHAIGRGWSSSFSYRKRVVWSGAAACPAQGRQGTNVKPRHVHTYALWAVKKEVQKLYYQKHVAAAEEEREIV